jgi:hypothetical protein
MDSVSYAFMITQGWMEARSMSGSPEVKGMGHIEGNLLEPVPYRLIGEPIELVLQDGRRWHCFIQSTNGNLVNRGGLQ